MQEQQLFSVLDQMPGFFYLQSPDYSIRYPNRYFREKFGDPEGKTCYEVFHGSKNPCKRCRTFKVFETQKKQKWEWTTPEANTYQIYDHPFTGSDGALHVLKLGIDITDRKKMEDERVRARKLESIAFLAGGIAHDFNNLLTSVMGNISLAKMHLKQGGKALERLKDAEGACMRAKHLTYQLVTFARGEEPVRKAVMLPGIIKETADFALRNSGCSCEFSIAEDLCAVEIDASQISQVIHNILMNAQDAMPAGGAIEIRAENITVAAENTVTPGPGRYVKMTVRDQGAGILPEHLSKVFDPYFTTQKMDSRKGLGLGLALCYSIIASHGGHIAVESEIGKGTTFSIYLPAAERAA